MKNVRKLNVTSMMTLSTPLKATNYIINFMLCLSIVSIYLLLRVQHPHDFSVSVHVVLILFQLLNGSCSVTTSPITGSEIFAR